MTRSSDELTKIAPLRDDGVTYGIPLGSDASPSTERSMVLLIASERAETRKFS